MKKIIILIVLIIYLSITIKYFLSSYEINYEINGTTIKEIYENNRYYFLIDNKYNVDYYKNRKMSKKLIKDFNIIKENNYECLSITIIKDTFIPVCSHNNEYITYELLTNKEKTNKVITSNKDFNYYIKTEDYIAVWKYNGFYIFNNGNVQEINIFNNDTYNNTLSLIVDNLILMPNYDEEHIFTSFIVLNIETGKYEKIKTKYEIDYDSYIAGIYNNKVYLFDNKYELLYEINLKNNKVSLIGNDKEGYIKLVNGQKKQALKSEYTIEKITYFQEKNNIIVNNNYYNYIENKDIKIKYVQDDVTVLKVYKNKIYYILDSKIYSYNIIEGTNLILDYFELKFNNTNIFIFNS